MLRHPVERGAYQPLVGGSFAERAQPAGADDRLVTYEPIEQLVEQARIVPRDLEREEHKRLGVLCPSAVSTGRAEYAHPRPFIPGEIEQRSTESSPKGRGRHR